jgi:hypothetical protein
VILSSTNPRHLTRLWSKLTSSYETLLWGHQPQIGLSQVHVGGWMLDYYIAMDGPHCRAGLRRHILPHLHLRPAAPRSPIPHKPAKSCSHQLLLLRRAGCHKLRFQRPNRVRNLRVELRVGVGGPCLTAIGCSWPTASTTAVAISAGICVLQRCNGQL